MAKKRHTRRISKRGKRYSRKMSGGALDEGELLGLGFTSEQIIALQGYSIDNMNLIRMSLKQTNPKTNLLFTPQELIDSLEDVMNETDNSDHEMSSLPLEQEQEQYSLNQSDIEQVSPLTIQDLGPYSPRSITEEPSGGKKRKSMKKRRSTKKRRSMKKRRSINKRQTGGMCFGNGVGANSADPNFSIYNTRELELFPYVPK